MSSLPEWLVHAGLDQKTPGVAWRWAVVRDSGSEGPCQWWGGGSGPPEGGPLVTTVGGGQGWGHLRTIQSQAGHLGCAVAPASGEGTNCGNKLQQCSFVVKRKLQNLSGCF